MTLPRPGRLATLAALLLASCIDAGTDPSRDPAISLSVFSGNNQVGEAGQELPQPIKVLATNSNNDPIPNQVVNFVVTAGGGSVFAGTALTDANGIAAEIWTLGPVAGSPQTVEVRAVASDGTKQVFGVFTATAIAGGAPVLIGVNDGDGQSANAGSAVATPPSVLVTDAGGNPVEDVTVTFAVASGGGSITGGTALTDASGIARVGSWTLGPLSGSNSLTATASGSGISGNPVTVSATALGNFWSGRAAMPTPRRFAAVGVINGLIYVAGGKDANLNTVKTLEIYNPATNTWTTAKAMNTARVGPSYGVINGLLYVAGGTNPSNVILNTVESYNPATNTWTNRAAMPIQRNFGASTVIDGILYIAGGGTTGGQTASVVAYNPTTNTWSTRASLPAIRNDAVATTVNDLMYMFGGNQNNSNDGAVLIYDPLLDSWSSGATMITARAHANTGQVNGLIYVAGGTVAGGGNTPITEVYDPVANTWSPAASLATARNGAATAAVGGILYLAGGSNSGGVLGSHEAYVP